MEAYKNIVNIFIRFDPPNFKRTELLMEKEWKDH